MQHECNFILALTNLLVIPFSLRALAESILCRSNWLNILRGEDTTHSEKWSRVSCRREAITPFREMIRKQPGTYLHQQILCFTIKIQISLKESDFNFMGIISLETNESACDPVLLIIMS